MTNIEKVLLPLISDDIKQEDVSNDAGFIGLYTIDTDNPKPYEFYLAYDADVRSDASIERARRFSSCKDIKYTRLRFIDNKPLLVYTFWCKPELKNIDGYFRLTSDVKVRILQFWNFAKDVKQVFDLRYIHLDDIRLPAADYRPRLAQKLGLAA